MLDVANSPEARQISQLSALWASNCFEPIPTNADKFKKQLAMEEIEIIETLAKDYMEMYGYELMTPAQADIGDALFKAARKRSEATKQATWRELEQNNYRDFLLRRFRADYLAKVRLGLEQSMMTAAAVTVSTGEAQTA